MPIFWTDAVIVSNAPLDAELGENAPEETTRFGSWANERDMEVGAVSANETSLLIQPPDSCRKHTLYVAPHDV